MSFLLALPNLIGLACSIAGAMIVMNNYLAVLGLTPRNLFSAGAVDILLLVALMM
jgi:hypothetical protein